VVDGLEKVLDVSSAYLKRIPPQWDPVHNIERLELVSVYLIKKFQIPLGLPSDLRTSETY
jgi:hypothetical protein